MDRGLRDPPLFFYLVLTVSFGQRLMEWSPPSTGIDVPKW